MEMAHHMVSRMEKLSGTAESGGAESGGKEDGNRLRALCRLRLIGGCLRRGLSATLFPPRCLICGNLYSAPEVAAPPGAPGNAPAPPQWQAAPRAIRFRMAMAPHLCPACADDFAGPAPPPPSLPGIGRAVAFGEHAGALRAAIHRFKYAGRLQLARPLGMLLLADFLNHWKPGEIDRIIPVPLHPSRLRWRGFNQAALPLRHWRRIARSAAMTAPHGPADEGLLIRRRNTAAQMGMRRKERRINIRDAFAVARPDRARGARLLLVDDVFTTGATLSECARTLLESGAERVDVLTLSRAR